MFRQQPHPPTQSQTQSSQTPKVTYTQEQKDHAKLTLSSAYTVALKNYVQPRQITSAVQWTSRVPKLMFDNLTNYRTVVEPKWPPTVNFLPILYDSVNQGVWPSKAYLDELDLQYFASSADLRAHGINVDSVPTLNNYLKAWWTQYESKLNEAKLLQESKQQKLVQDSIIRSFMSLIEEDSCDAAKPIYSGQNVDTPVFSQSLEQVVPDSVQILLKPNEEEKDCPLVEPTKTDDEAQLRDLKDLEISDDYDVDSQQLGEAIDQLNEERQSTEALLQTLRHFEAPALNPYKAALDQIDCISDQLAYMSTSQWRLFCSPTMDPAIKKLQLDALQAIMPALVIQYQDYKLVESGQDLDNPVQVRSYIKMPEPMAQDKFEELHSALGKQIVDPQYLASVNLQPVVELATAESTVQTQPLSGEPTKRVKTNAGKAIQAAQSSQSPVKETKPRSKKATAKKSQIKKTEDK